MATKLTPWFSGDVKPARKGVYLRKYMAGDAYSRWDGKAWMRGSWEHDLAKKMCAFSLNQHLQWRGLASPPASVSQGGKES